MLNSIAILGRPNVGKSSLFNKLTKTRNAIVSDYSGLTKDRKIKNIINENKIISLSNELYVHHYNMNNVFIKIREFFLKKKKQNRQNLRQK